MDNLSRLSSFSLIFLSCSSQSSFLLLLRLSTVLSSLFSCTDSSLPLSVRLPWFPADSKTNSASYTSTAILMEDKQKAGSTCSSHSSKTKRQKALSHDSTEVLPEGIHKPQFPAATRFEIVALSFLIESIFNKIKFKSLLSAMLSGCRLFYINIV